MRVLHLSSLYAPYALGGAENVVQTIAEGAAQRGVETAVACLVPSPEPPSRRNGVEVFPLEHRNPLWLQDYARFPGPVRQVNKVATLFNVLTAQDLSRLMEAYRPDVVHSHSMVALTPLMWKVAKDKGATVVHTLHDYDLACIRAALIKGDRRCTHLHLPCAVFAAFKRHYHRDIDQVVGVSQAVLDIHLRHGFFEHLPASRRHVVWNPVLTREPVQRQEASASDGVVTFGFLGRLVVEKGIELLLEACRRMAPGGWRLKIAGRAPNGEDHLKALAENLPVSFEGHVERDAFLDSIDVLVAPSIWDEPFGLTVVEAYAAGVPVIGSNIAGVAEIISSVDASWLVEAGNAQRLADKMASVVAAGRERLSGFAVPASLFARTAPDYVVDRYLEIYAAR